jgi:hypothetical protein
VFVKSSPVAVRTKRRGYASVKPSTCWLSALEIRFAAVSKGSKGALSIRGVATVSKAYESAYPPCSFVVIGASIAVGIGYVVEREVSSTASLIVFLALFFANFAVSWIAVILVMDGTLKDAQGRQAQLDIERSGRAGIALREANAIAGRAAKQS